MGMFITNEERIYNLNNATNTSETILASQPQVVAIHRVKKGEKLSTIAKKYGCSISDLKQWNNLKSNSATPGKKLNIYSKTSEKPANTTASVDSKGETEKEETEKKVEAPVAKQSEQFKYYTIQKGDTLYKIAQRQQTTIEEIKRLNNFSTKYTLMPGKKIKVGVF
jgi:membrane-bound lytic murein transglycosylase D